MPYVSHPVRHVRDDPREGETLALVVRVDDDHDPEAVAGTLAELGAEDVEDRGLGALAATVPQPAVADVCALDGLASVETTDTLSMHPDGAGEDVEYHE
jgi:hypothetical protein